MSSLISVSNWYLRAKNTAFFNLKKSICLREWQLVSTITISASIQMISSTIIEGNWALLRWYLFNSEIDCSIYEKPMVLLLLCSDPLSCTWNFGRTHNLLKLPIVLFLIYLKQSRKLNWMYTKDFINFRKFSFIMVFWTWYFEQRIATELYNMKNDSHRQSLKTLVGIYWQSEFLKIPAGCWFLCVLHVAFLSNQYQYLNRLKISSFTETKI